MILSDSNSIACRNWLHEFAEVLLTFLGGCVLPLGLSLAVGAARKLQEHWEFHHCFLAFGARFRYHLRVIKDHLRCMKFNVFMKDIVTIKSRLCSEKFTYRCLCMAHLMWTIIC